MFLKSSCCGAESNSLHAGPSQILLEMLESRRRCSAAHVISIRPTFVALHAERRLLNGFVVVSEASQGSLCTMWPSVFIPAASTGTFPEINTPRSESPLSIVPFALLYSCTQQHSPVASISI